MNNQVDTLNRTVKFNFALSINENELNRLIDDETKKHIHNRITPALHKTAVEINKGLATKVLREEFQARFDYSLELEIRKKLELYLTRDKIDSIVKEVVENSLNHKTHPHQISRLEYIVAQEANAAIKKIIDDQQLANKPIM